MAAPMICIADFSIRFLSTFSNTGSGECLSAHPGAHAVGFHCHFWDAHFDRILSPQRPSAYGRPRLSALAPRMFPVTRNHPGVAVGVPVLHYTSEFLKNAPFQQYKYNSTRHLRRIQNMIHHSGCGMSRDVKSERNSSPGLPRSARSNGRRFVLCRSLPAVYVVQNFPIVRWKDTAQRRL
jgi:hypothetical protein